MENELEAVMDNIQVITLEEPANMKLLNKTKGNYLEKGFLYSQ